MPRSSIILRKFDLSPDLKGSRLVSLPSVRVLSSSLVQVVRRSLQPAFHNDSRRYLVTFYAKSIRETARTL